MQTSLKILVVEDDESLRSALVGLFKAFEFTNVFSANDGDVALELLVVGGDYELVVSDYNMPKMDGLQLLEAMRKNEQLRHIKVVMMTGFKDLSALHAAGADAVLRKPFPFEHLKAIIVEMFP